MKKYKERWINYIDYSPVFSYIKVQGQTRSLYWNSWQWVDSFADSCWKRKSGQRNVSWELFTHQHSVDEGQTQLVKVEVSSLLWEVCNNLNHNFLISQRGWGPWKIVDPSQCSHTPSLVLACLCDLRSEYKCICLCLHVNVQVCVRVCVCSRVWSKQRQGSC